MGHLLKSFLIAVMILAIIVGFVSLMLGGFALLSSGHVLAGVGVLTLLLLLLITAVVDYTID